MHGGGGHLVFGGCHALLTWPVGIFTLVGVRFGNVCFLWFYDCVYTKAHVLFL